MDSTRTHDCAHRQTSRYNAKATEKNKCGKQIKTYINMTFSHGRNFGCAYTHFCVFYRFIFSATNDNIIIIIYMRVFVYVSCKTLLGLNNKQ